MTEQDVRVLVRERMGGMSQGACARSLGVSDAGLSLFLRGGSRPPKTLLASLGLVAVVTYQRAANGKPEVTSPARRSKPVFRYGDWPVRMGR